MPAANAPVGTRITFTGPDGVEKTLYYFSTDLSNAGAKSSGFLKFCSTLAPGNSLIKSASYLLHSGNFTVARDYLLANSATIIQDDSGVPLQYYNNKQWRFFPFGRYNGPIGEFPGRYQQSYAELFRNAEPINFGIGYRWRTNDSNLLLSVKTAERRLGAGGDHLVGRCAAATRRRVRRSRNRRRRRSPDSSGSVANPLSSPPYALARHDEGRRARRWPSDATK